MPALRIFSLVPGVPALLRVQGAAATFSTGVLQWKVSSCAIFLHLKNGVFSPMLAMYNGFHSSEVFGRNDSVHLIAGIRLDVLVQVSFCYFFSAGLKNVAIKQTCPRNLQEKSSRMRPAPKRLKHYQ